MNDYIAAAKALESVGVVGILAGLNLVQFAIIKKLFQLRENCLKKLVAAND